jgi:hypothetical protein
MGRLGSELVTALGLAASPPDLVSSLDASPSVRIGADPSSGLASQSLSAESTRILDESDSARKPGPRFQYTGDGGLIVVKGLRMLALTAAVAATGVAGATTAAAKTGEVGSPTIAGAKPAGYLLVNATFPVAAGAQTRGTVACPPKGAQARSAQGGGAVIESSALGANINSSFPNGNGWGVDVNNNTSSATSFVVYAVCAVPTKKYQVVISGTVTNSAFTQASATAVCPPGTKVLGGGGFSSSGSVLVNINTSIPQNNGWRLDENNASGSAASINAYAICASQAKKAHYGVTVGAPLTNFAGTEGHAEAVCPTGLVPLGGGGYSSTGSTSVNMNSSNPFSNGWSVYENNASGGDATITAYVVCAS